MVGDLRQYLFVGLQEHYEESIDMLEWYTGIQMRRIHRNFRRVPVYEPSRAEEALFHILSGHDLDHYKEAKRVFNRQREEYRVSKADRKESS
jgi:hypothetical protein